MLPGVETESTMTDKYPRTIHMSSNMKHHSNTCVLLLSLSLSLCLHADVGTFKDWTWRTDETPFYSALTVNSNKHTLGQYCSITNETCFYMAGFDITCEPGSSYPSLVNSDKGAYHVTLKCAHEHQGRNLLAIYEFDKIDSLIREASHIGFAIPMSNSHFKLVEFSLMGSSEAIDQMRAAAKSAIDAREPPEKSTYPGEEII